MCTAKRLPQPRRRLFTNGELTIKGCEIMKEKFDFRETLDWTIRGKLGRIEFLAEGGKGEREIERDYPAVSVACYARDALDLARGISEDLVELDRAVFLARAFLQTLEGHKWPGEDKDSEASRLKQQLSDNLRRLKLAESLCVAVRGRLGRDTDAELCGLYQGDEGEI